METGEYCTWVLERIALGGVIRLQEGKNTVGRLPTSTIKVNSSFSSRYHCELTVSPNGLIHLEDFSSNGTYINSQQYKNTTVHLSDGDRIGIGCDVTDEQCVNDIYVMYILRHCPLDGSPSKSNISPEQLSKIKNVSLNSPSVEKSHVLHNDNNNSVVNFIQLHKLKTY